MGTTDGSRISVLTRPDSNHLRDLYYNKSPDKELGTNKLPLTGRIWEKVKVREDTQAHMSYLSPRILLAGTVLAE